MWSPTAGSINPWPWALSACGAVVLVMVIAPHSPRPKTSDAYDMLCANHACVGGFVKYEKERRIYRVGLIDGKDSPSEYTMSGQRLKALFVAGEPIEIILHSTSDKWHKVASDHAQQFLIKTKE